MNDIEEIEKLKKEIDDLLPELKQKKAEFDKISVAYYKIKRKRTELQAKIDAIEKKIQVETFKKSVGKGELLSFREFFKEIRNGRDFTGKTIVWSFKNGKSGMFVNLWIQNNDVSKKLLDSYLKRKIYNPDTVVSIVNDFSSLDFEEFRFEAFTVGSMVDGRTFHDKTLDDVFVFICDTKTLGSFENVADTKGLCFFEHLPYVYQSPGKTHNSGGIDYLTLGCSGIPKIHYKNYKLYPLQTAETY